MSGRSDSKNKVWAIVSAMGVLLSILTSLVAGLRKRRVNEEMVYRLGLPEGEQQLAKIMDSAAAILIPPCAVKEADREVVREDGVFYKARKLRTWRITTGGMTGENLEKAIKAKGDEVTEYAHDIVGNEGFRATSEPREILLAALPLRDLGYTEQPGTDDWITNENLDKRSRETLDGYVAEMVEPEDVAHFRLAYEDQPRGEVIFAASRRITDRDRSPSVLNVERSGDGRRWLGTGYADPGGRWLLGSLVLVRLRKIA